jgi:hypothetical protein
MSRTSITGFSIIAAVILVAAAAIGIIRPTVHVVQAFERGADSWPEASFREGAWFAEGRDIPKGIRTRGSRVDGNPEWRGSFVSGWFAARPQICVFVSGFPRIAGNRLELEVRHQSGTVSVISFAAANPRDCWRPWTITLPRDAVAFRVRATDDATGSDGWLAIAEPFVPRLLPALWSQTARTYLALAAQLILVAAIASAAVRLGKWRRWQVPDAMICLLGLAGVALVGYLGFWIYLANASAGKTFSWTVCVLTVASLAWPRARDYAMPTVPRGVVLVFVATAVLYFSLLLLFEPGRLSYTAANRFDANLPSDNEIPRAFAERLWKGESPRQLWGDWLSSDRPPLQSGWLLLTWPVLHSLGIDLDTAANTAGSCFQLLWIPAVWALLQSWRIPRRKGFAILAALPFTGILLQYSVFVWPKLAAAALMVGAFVLCFDSDAPPGKFSFAAAGVLAALGCLAHGGVAFSLLGIIIIVFARPFARRWKYWLIAFVMFCATIAPWLAYQRFYEPPGDRLVKMHLAGVAEPTTATAGHTIRDAYRQIGWRAACHARWENFKIQFAGNWVQFFRPLSAPYPTARRETETMYTMRTCSWWLLGLVGAGVYAWRAATRRPVTPPTSGRKVAFAWLITGVAVWIALIFLPGAATVHQGTLVTELLALTLLATSALDVSPMFFCVVATLQATWFLVAWAPPSTVIEGRLQAIPGALVAVGSTILLGLVWIAALKRDEATV